jgi:hypothetical protein
MGSEGGRLGPRGEVTGASPGDVASPSPRGRVRRARLAATRLGRAWRGSPDLQSAGRRPQPRVRAALFGEDPAGVTVRSRPGARSRASRGASPPSGRNRVRRARRRASEFLLARRPTGSTGGYEWPCCSSRWTVRLSPLRGAAHLGTPSWQPCAGWREASPGVSERDGWVPLKITSARSAWVHTLSKSVARNLRLRRLPEETRLPAPPTGPGPDPATQSQRAGARGAREC